MNTITKTKTKNNIAKSMSLLFFCVLYQSKNHVIPHTVIVVILDVILNISNTENNNNSKYNHCWKLSENYRKKVINCDQVEFCFKMAAILDTILNIWTF